MGLFREVILYGQERDTARLEVVGSSESEIRFALSDDMDDDAFAYTLTVKVRLPNKWAAVTATQRDLPIEARRIEHEGHAYALVQAVPDRGAVVLRKK